MKASMPAEAEDEIGTLAEARQAALDPGAEIADAGGQRMAPVLLDSARAPRLGMQIWSVGRKPMRLALGMGLHRRFARLRAMGVAPVPADDEGAANVPLAVTAGEHDVIAADGRRDGSRVEATRQGASDDRGACTTRADAPQDRCWPLRRPGGPRLGPAGAAGLVAKHHLCLVAACRFCSWGQAGLSQGCTGASSRSRASTAGGGGLPPSACRRRARSCALERTNRPPASPHGGAGVSTVSAIMKNWLIRAFDTDVKIIPVKAWRLLRRSGVLRDSRGVPDV
jgi:hypothetical protein